MCCRLDAVVAAVRESTRRVRELRRRRSRRWRLRETTYHTDDYGLGNRINIVTSTLALAMATGRSLIVLWPHTDCRHTSHGDCDPTSINDLFVENETRAQWGVGSHAQCINTDRFSLRDRVRLTG